jgi:hypothetical protein
MSREPANLLKETLLTLNQAAHHLPPGRNGAAVSFSCVLRWIKTGCPGPDGRPVRLEGIRVGGRWLTSEEALSRWAERLTPKMDGEAAPVPRSPTARTRASSRAGETLDKIGI